MNGARRNCDCGLGQVDGARCDGDLEGGGQGEEEDGAVDETEKLRKGLRQVLERRHRQFGFYEALLVGSGTMLVALGCVLYLVGVLIESH